MEKDKDDDEENKTILIHQFNQQESKSHGHPDHSLNSVYNKTLKGSTLLREDF